MASRYASPNSPALCCYSRTECRLHQRSARDALFSNYDAQTRSRPSSAASANTTPRPSSRNAPYNANSSPYGLQPHATDSSSHLSAQPPAGAGFSAYPGSDYNGRGSGDGGFRSATPDKKGRYSDAVYNELESQNDEQVGQMTEKVKMLKSVSENYLAPRGAEGEVGDMADAE